MIGPPSGAGTCGTAAAIYVPTSPSIRTEILIASFMGHSFCAKVAPKIGHYRRGEELYGTSQAFLQEFLTVQAAGYRGKTLFAIYLTS
jgi:hypothetical protein